MTRYNPNTEDPIRAYPVWLARLANRLVHWTDGECGAGCGRPITGVFRTQVDTIEGLPVWVLLCSVGGECERSLSGATTTQRYAAIRPGLVRQAPEAKAEGAVEFMVDLRS